MQCLKEQQQQISVNVHRYFLNLFRVLENAVTRTNFISFLEQISFTIFRFVRNGQKETRRKRENILINQD